MSARFKHFAHAHSKEGVVVVAFHLLQGGAATAHHWLKLWPPAAKVPPYERTTKFACIELGCTGLLGRRLMARKTLSARALHRSSQPFFSSLLAPLLTSSHPLSMRHTTEHMCKIFIAQHYYCCCCCCCCWSARRSQMIMAKLI